MTLHKNDILLRLLQQWCFRFKILDSVPTVILEQVENQNLFHHKCFKHSDDLWTLLLVTNIANQSKLQEEYHLDLLLTYGNLQNTLLKVSQIDLTQEFTTVNGSMLVQLLSANRSTTTQN